MSAPTLPGTQPGRSTQTAVSAAQRAREIQDALKAIVLQTASTLRARNQQARLSTSVASSSGPAASAMSESSVNLQQLTGECTRYLSLVHGLRDYLLHAQAALEIELEAATQREAEEAKKAAQAAAEALKRQQEAQAEAQRKAAEEAQVKAQQKPEGFADANDNVKAEGADGGQKEGEADDSMVATPPLPSTEGTDTAAAQTGTTDATAKGKAGEAAKDAIVIDSDGDDDEDDVPLAFAPKPGAAIDLTDSPALSNAAKPAASATDAASTSTAPVPTGSASTDTSSIPAAAPNTVAGIDLSALGINLSSLNNLPDLSSLGIPALSSSASGDAAALEPATDFSELEKMMGMGFSTTSTADASAGAPDLSSLGSFNLSTGTGFGEDLFGTNAGGLDLSNFDFSSLTSFTADGAPADAGVDLSSFLTNLNPAQLDGGGAAN